MDNKIEDDKLAIVRRNYLDFLWNTTHRYDYDSLNIEYYTTLRGEKLIRITVVMDGREYVDWADINTLEII